MELSSRPLDADTWDAFAELVEPSFGIFGGCWCIGYHPEAGQKGVDYRTAKQEPVRTEPGRPPPTRSVTGLEASSGG